MGVGALAHVLGPLRPAPGGAQRLAVVGYPPVLQQIPCSRPLLRVLLEALVQEVVHVPRHLARQLRLFILQAHGQMQERGMCGKMRKKIWRDLL